MNTWSGFQGLDSLTEHVNLRERYFVLPTVFFAKQKNISMMQEPLLHDVSLKKYLSNNSVCKAKRVRIINLGLLS